MASLGISPNANVFVLIASIRQWTKYDVEIKNAGIGRFVSRPLFPSDIINALDGIVGNASVASKHTSEIAVCPDFSHVTLLLVEDVLINREIFAALLEKTNVTIHMAENGLEAIEKFSANPERYDCIIMDLRMPEMDGFEATMRIRALDVEKAKLIPIIAMTADAFREDVERCIKCGMNDHLAKPIDEMAIMKKIQFYCC